MQAQSEILIDNPGGNNPVKTTQFGLFTKYIGKPAFNCGFSMTQESRSAHTPRSIHSVGVTPSQRGTKGKYSGGETGKPGVCF